MTSRSTAVVEARTPDLVARLEASWWRIELPGVDPGAAVAAVEALLAQDEAPVQRRTKNGMRTLDARAAILVLEVEPARAGEGLGPPCAILTLVVRHGTPSVRPDDVLAALRRAADLAPVEPPRVTRLAQGPLDQDGRSVGDPFAPDRGEDVVGT